MRVENLTITAENADQYKDVTSVGYVYVREGAMFRADALTSVSDSVVVREGATFRADALTSAGSVYVREGATFRADALTSVSGHVDVCEGATFRADALTSAGSVDVCEGATFRADALAECYGVKGRSLRFPGPWLLWAGADGKYYAGCKRGLTYRQCFALAKAEPDGWTKEASRRLSEGD